MSWLSDNYKWLFDGFLGSIIILVIGWAFKRRSKSEGSRGVHNSSVISGGSGNIQTPIQIGTAGNVHIGVGDRSAGQPPSEGVRTERAKANIRCVDARTVCLEDKFGGGLTEGNSADNALVIRFANEPTDGAANKTETVKATLIFRDGGQELCDITGRWLGVYGDAASLEPDGRRHTLVVGIARNREFTALEVEPITAHRGKHFRFEPRSLNPFKTGTVFVRLTTLHTLRVLYEGHFTINTNPLAIAQLSSRIREPREGAMVSLRQIVHGTVTPAGHPVRVLVFSPDNQWHVQGLATVKESEWSIECQFGLPESKPGIRHLIVAIDGDCPIAPLMSNLPDGIAKSEIVNVIRK